MELDKATQTQIRNIQTRTGKSLDQLFAVLKGSGMEKFGQMRDFLKTELGMGHGDAHLVVTLYTKEGGEPAPADPLDAIYSTGKEVLRPIHDAIMAEIRALGEFEIAAKKTYISLRRKKQFAMVGPATKTRVEVGLNMKGVDATDRLIALPAGGMCQYKVSLTDVGEVDAELVSWIRIAYEAAG